jgi:hypothetical protein
VFHLRYTPPLFFETVLRITCNAFGSLFGYLKYFSFPYEQDSKTFPMSSPQSASFSVAVVGGGITGSVFVCELFRLCPKWRISLFDQGRALGGRTSHRRVNSSGDIVPTSNIAPYVFDHGCQFFRADSSEFTSQVRPYAIIISILVWYVIMDIASDSLFCRYSTNGWREAMLLLGWVASWNLKGTALERVVLTFLGFRMRTVVCTVVLVVCIHLLFAASRRRLHEVMGTFVYTPAPELLASRQCH